MYRHGPEEIAAVSRVLQSGQWFRFGDEKAGHQQETAQFEAEWARTIGVQHACFCGSGTAALMCCYAGLQVGPGDEVIIPGYTWIASAYAPLAVGAIPVIVDVDDSLTIDPAAVERAITPRTKVINPVHMNGLICDMDRILDIARRHGLRVVEDACQCDGGFWKDGARAGSLGDMAAFSFNFYKVISCGDGGMFVANRKDAFERGLIFHDGGCIFRPHGKDLSVEPFAGMNLRGNEILAAVMRVQLARLDGILRDLHRVRSRILERIQGVAGLRAFPYNGGMQTGTGAFLGLKFEDEKQARAFAAGFAAHPGRCGAGASLPIDSGRHVYSNWDPVLQKRGAFSDAANPYTHPLNRASAASYSKEMLPRTLEILQRTVLISMNPDWRDEQIESVALAIRAQAG